MHSFTPEEISYLRAQYPKLSQKELTQEFNRHFGLDLQITQIKACLKNHRIKSGRTGWFEKGRVPANKGKKGISYPGMEATQFKKGQKPINHRPVGSERVNVQGYVEIKVAEPSKWRLKHQVVWEKHNGPIPKGFGILFKDGNGQNVELDNLMLITKAQRAILNKRGLAGNGKEITETSIMLVDLMLKIGKRKREKKKTKKNVA